MSQKSLTQLLYRAEALMKTNWIFAIRILEEATEEHPNDPRPLISLAEFYIQRQHYNLAIEKLQSALKLAPDDNLIKYLIGNCYFAVADYRMALVYYNMIYELSNEVRYNKAMALYYHGKTQESSLIIKELLKEMDNIPLLYFVLLEQLLKIGQNQEAEKYIRIAEEKVGKHSHLVMAKAILYAQKGNFISAYDAYKESDKMSPIIGYDQLSSYASCAMKLGLFEQARDIWYRAIEDSPYLSLAYENLLRLLIERNDYEAARQVMKKAKMNIPRPNPILKLLFSRLKKV